MIRNIGFSSIFRFIELCRAMGQHLGEHLCERGYPHLAEESQIVTKTGR